MADLSSISYAGTTYTIPAGGPVDDALSSTSENPVQNKVINTALGALDTRVAALEALLLNYTDTILQMSDGTNTVNKFVLAKNSTV